jgi:hypothetical protein
MPDQIIHRMRLLNNNTSRINYISNFLNILPAPDAGRDIHTTANTNVSDEPGFLKLIRANFTIIPQYNSTISKA